MFPPKKKISFYYVCSLSRSGGAISCHFFLNPQMTLQKMDMESLHVTLDLPDFGGGDGRYLR